MPFSPCLYHLLLASQAGKQSSVGAHLGAHRGLCPIGGRLRASRLGNWMEAPPPPRRCPSVTRGQLTNAQGRGRSQALGHGRRGTGSRQCGAAGHRYRPRCWMLPWAHPRPARPPSCSRCERLQVKQSALLLRPPDKPNPGFLLPFPLNIYSSLRPPSWCPRDTHLWRVCTLSRVALASVEWPLFHTPGNNLLILQDIKMCCG